MQTGRKKLSDVITEQLESMILDGSLLAGEKLPPERELARIPPYLRRDPLRLEKRSTVREGALRAGLCS